MVLALVVCGVFLMLLLLLVVYLTSDLANGIVEGNA